MAPVSPPVTGASSMSTSCCFKLAAKSWPAMGEMVLMSMTTEPGVAPSMMPPGPAIAASTCCESGTMVMVMSDRDATSAGLEPAFAPSITSCSTASGSRS